MRFSACLVSLTALALSDAVRRKTRRQGTEASLVGGCKTGNGECSGGWCGSSPTNCGQCGGTWCDAPTPAPTTTPAPTPTPAPAPTPAPDNGPLLQAVLQVLRNSNHEFGTLMNRPSRIYRWSDMTTAVEAMASRGVG